MAVFQTFQNMASNYMASIVKQVNIIFKLKSLLAVNMKKQ